MAHFYGTVKGMGQTAHRTGSKKSGLSVAAASWQGSVSVGLWHDSRNNVDMCEVELRPWQGAGASRLLYRGPVSGAGAAANPGAAWHTKKMKEHFRTAAGMEDRPMAREYQVGAAEAHEKSAVESKRRRMARQMRRKGWTPKSAKAISMAFKGNPRRRQLSTKELSVIWEDDKEGEYVQMNDSGTFYVAHGRTMERISDKPFDFAAVRAWAAGSAYWPNIWHVNERGNVELYDYQGKSLGGLV